MKSGEPTQGLLCDDFGSPNGWRAVMAGAMGCALGAGVVAVYAFGIFLKPISEEFGWPRSILTTGIAIFYFFSGLGSLILGGVISRWKPRWPTGLGVVLFGVALATLALVPPVPVIFLAIFAAIGLFGSSATAQPYAVTISSWFDRRRGLALAIAVAGSGIGTATMSLYATWLLQNYGWRGGNLGIGLLVGLGGALAALLIMPRQREEAEPVKPNYDSGQCPVTLTAILLDRAFLLIAVPIFLFSVALSAVLSTLVPYLTDGGMSAVAAAAIMATGGLGSWVGRIAAAILLDRVHAPKLMAAIFLVAATAIAVIAIGASGIFLVCAVVAISAAMGTEADVVTFSVSRYFAPEAYSKALGAVWIYWAWGGGCGSLLTGAAYSLTGSYSSAFWPSATLILTAIVMVLALGPYRYEVHHRL